MDLNGKVALITGAAQGLGKAFSEALLSKGAKVCLTDVNDKQGKITTEEFQKLFGKDNAFFIKCDVTSENDFTNVFKKTKDKFGKLDIVVNNAGICNEKNWRLAININLIGVIQGTQLGIDNMSRENGGDGGLILNIASAAGLAPAFIMPAYCATKFGIVGYSRSWAQNPTNATTGLRFCCLCPSFAATTMITPNEVNSISQPHSHALQKHFGILEVSKVAEGFMELVTDESNNGAVMKITPKDGIEYPHSNAAS